MAAMGPSSLDQREGSASVATSRLGVLPQEILVLILRFACQTRPLPSITGEAVDDDEHEDEGKDEEDIGRRLPTRSSLLYESTVLRTDRQYEVVDHVDLKTCRQAVIVCKRWRPIVTSCLYESVQLNEAWSLQRFARSLRSQPDLGTHVRNLWVGHVTPGPPLPTQTTSDPPGENVHRCFGFEDEDTTAEFRALMEEMCRTCGLDGTGVCPHIVGLDASRNWVGADEWVHRIFEVHERFVDPRQSLSSRRPEVEADHFLHPVLFARSRAVYLLTGHLLPPYSFPTFDDLPTRDEDDGHPSDVWGSVPDPSEGFESLVQEMKALTTRSAQTPQAPTIQALLRDVVAILRRCPSIQTLSLNGTFERAITSPTIPFATSFPRLRNISFGPPPLYWEAELNFGGLDHPIFAHVEDLSVYGCLFFTSEARALAGENGALPNLKRLRWCYNLEPVDMESTDLYTIRDTIRLLLGINRDARTEAEQEEAQFRARLSETSAAELAQTLNQPPPASRRRGVQQLHCTFAKAAVIEFQQQADPELLADPRLTIEIGRSDDQIEDVYRSYRQQRASSVRMAYVLEHLHAIDVLPAHALIKPSAAALISVGLTSTFVLTLYLSTSTRVGSKAAFYTTTREQTVRVRRRREPNRNKDAGAGDDVGTEEGDEYEEVDEVQTRQVEVPLDKNHPKVVAARLRVASQSTAATIAVTYGFLSRWGAPKVIKSTWFRLPIVNLFLGLPTPIPSFLNSSLLPLQPSLSSLLVRHYLPAALLPLGLTTSLFLGPLFETWLDEELLPGQRDWSWKECVASKFDNIWALRNYIIAPLTEELVFRACILNFHHASGASKSTLVFVTPLYFGVAHLHHAWESYVQGGRTKQALVRGVLQSCFQFAFTSVFGWYANFLFLRTNSIISAVLCHSFCNMMGFPNPAGAIQRHPRYKTAIVGSYLVGIATFAYSLWKVTEPALYGGSVFWK
ncbi:hypothetical protein CF327_g3897 [Tilletia walkeri]|nr:hypothetical protein CF327_g3897 [Tilletia walkeri]